MHLTPLDIPDVWLIRPDRRVDARGFFARTFCAAAFAVHGLPTAFPQASIGFNIHRRTLRGLHWQADPHAEGKLVRCTRGAIFDVAVDVRPASPTFGRWVSATLSADEANALYVPPGFAHGYQTLLDGTEVFYQMTVPYVEGLSGGLRWNDPDLAITWPLYEPILSERDALLPTLR